MYAEERQRSIVDLARGQGRVEVLALAERFAVTPETIRRDLTVLERRGALRRVHGGAIPVERLGYELALPARDQLLVAEKERIAKAAIEELPDGGSIIIDAGTTTRRLAELMPSDREYTVVTNSLPIATTLSTMSNITLHVIGGRVRPRTLAVVDDSSLYLRDVYADVAIMGTNGISVEHGLTTSDRTEALGKQAVIKAARQLIVLADHTKFGIDYFAKFGELDDVDVVITDSGLDPAMADEIAAAGPRVVCA